MRENKKMLGHGSFVNVRPSALKGRIVGENALPFYSYSSFLDAEKNLDAPILLRDLLYLPIFGEKTKDPSSTRNTAVA